MKNYQNGNTNGYKTEKTWEEFMQDQDTKLRESKPFQPGKTGSEDIQDQMSRILRRHYDGCYN